jgi:hypothetical protein
VAAGDHARQHHPGLAYGCIFAAFYIDFTKLRAMRKAAIEADKAARRRLGQEGGKKTTNTRRSDSDA